jgi:hypothetical protein
MFAVSGVGRTRPKEKNKMTGFDKFLSTLRTIRSASRLASACEGGRRPHPDDLRRLGIDPHAFTSIGHG